MMLKRVFAVFLTLAIGGCSSSKPDADVSRSAPASDADRPAQLPSVDYGSGFFPQERAQDGSTFRWMGAEGMVRLKNTHQDMVLKIRGGAPTLSKPSTINLEINGNALDPILEARGPVEKTVEISAAKQGNDDWSTLHITISQTFVPHEINPKSSDQRRLGFTVYEVSWAQK